MNFFLEFSTLFSNKKIFFVASTTPSLDILTILTSSNFCFLSKLNIVNILILPLLAATISALIPTLLYNISDPFMKFPFSSIIIN